MIEEKDSVISSVESKAREEVAAARKAKSKQAAELHRKLRKQGTQSREAEERSVALQIVYASQLEATESQVYKSKGEAHSLQMR